MDDKDLIKAVLHYQQCLDKYTRRNDEARVLYCLSKLYKMPINIAHLQETGVGRTVNALRKHNGEIAEAAKTLVNKWKEMVAADAEESVTKETSKLDAIKNQYKEKNKTYKENSSSSQRVSDKKKFRSNSSSEEDEEEVDEVENLKHNQKKTKEDTKHSYSSEDDEENQEKVGDLKHKSKKTKGETKHSYSSDDEAVENLNDRYKKTKHRYSSDDECNNTKHSSKKNKEETKQRYSSEYEEIENSKRSSKKSKEESKERHCGDSKRKHEKHKSSKRKHDSSEESNEEKSDKNYKHRRSRSSSKEKNIKPEKNHKHSKRDSSALTNDHHEHTKSKRKKYVQSGDESEREQVVERKHLHKSSKGHYEKKEKSKHEHKKDKKDKMGESKLKKEESKSNDKGSSSSTGVSRSSSKNTKKDKDKDSKSDKKSKHSSSSSKKPKHSHSEKVTYGWNENGIGSGSGASFAEALGMLIPSSSKVTKKKVAVIHPLPINLPSPPSRDLSPDSKVPQLLSSKKLPPLDLKVDNLLPEITPNYRPLGLPIDSGLFKNKFSSEDETLSAIMYNKISRTKVYSGNKVAWGKVPSLFEICTRVLQDNIDALEYTGGVPYLILKPVIERANPDQLFTLEHHNPYLIEDTDELWQLHCNKEFRNKKREEMETWRDMYMRCLDEREAKLRALTANIKQSQDKSLPVRQTKLAYVDSVVKPPRNIARKQAKHGTGSGVGGGGSDKKPVVTPSARLNALATTGVAGQISVPNPGSRAISSSGSSTAVVKPKKAPLMQKTLALMKSRIFRR